MLDPTDQNESDFKEQYSFPASTIGYLADIEQQKKQDDQLLSAINKEVQGVLGQLQYISELLETNKNIGPVEDLNQKIKAAYEKIKALLNPENNLNAGLEATPGGAAGVSVEKNPLIKEMGGMPLDVISPEWRDVIEGQILDKAELENLINHKLKARVELANKLKAKNKLTHQPKLKPAQPLLPKFKKLQETLKYIIKEIPPPPKPAPTPSIPPPRPNLYGR